MDVLRLIKRREVLRSAAELPQEGFVRAKATGARDGQVITEEIINTYQLVCGCRVSRARDVGCPCLFCRAEWYAQCEEQQVVVAEEVVEASCLVCRSCQVRCAVPGCGVVCCPRHSVSIEGVAVCWDHYTELAEHAQVTQVRKRFGSIGALVFRLGRVVLAGPRNP